MTLPSSPPITLAQVIAEFGATTTTPLGSFLRGGSYVPNTPANSGVPTSLPISLGNLLGAQDFTASASPSTVSGSRATTGTCTTSTTTCTQVGGTSPIYDWTKVSGDAGATCGSPTSASTAFSTTVSPTRSSETSVWKCTVTSGSAVAVSNNVTATMIFTG